MITPWKWMVTKLIFEMGQERPKVFFKSEVRAESKYTPKRITIDTELEYPMISSLTGAWEFLITRCSLEKITKGSKWLASAAQEGRPFRAGGEPRLLTKSVSGEGVNQFLH